MTYTKVHKCLLVINKNDIRFVVKITYEDTKQFIYYVLNISFSAMETPTIQSVLKELEMENVIDIFREHELELELLKNMTDSELQSVFNGIGLSAVGKQWQIIKKIQELKSSGKYNLHVLVHYFNLLKELCMFYFVVEVGKTYFFIYKLPFAIRLCPSSCVLHRASIVSNGYFFF